MTVRGVRGEGGVVGTAQAIDGAVLRAVVEMSDDAIFTCDALGRINSWSATAERLLGLPAAEVFERHLETLFAKHLRSDLRSVVSTVLAGDRVRHFETEVHRRDGMPMPASLALCPLVGRTEECGDSYEAPLSLGFLVIVRDVTEQRLDQAVLAEFDARLEEAEALAHVGSWLWDRRTSAMQWSAEFHRIHAVDPIEFDGTLDSYISMIHEDDRDRMRTAMHGSVESGRPFECDYRAVRPAGVVGVVQLRGQPTLGSSGEPVGLRGVGRARGTSPGSGPAS